MEEYLQINLSNLLKVIGENGTNSILSDFSCPLNKDIEDFLKNKALSFSKIGFAKTHLVFLRNDKEINLVGYFAIANKPLEVDISALSNKMRSKIKNHGTLNLHTRKYSVPAILIAQFGKNFKNENNKLIKGDELMHLALNKVKAVQSDIGSRFTYVECENKEELIRFYKSHGFVEFGKRKTKDKSESNNNELVQLLKYVC